MGFLARKVEQKNHMTTVKNDDTEQGMGPGLVFVNAREALKITQAETADVLNLSVSVIKALESNDDSALPERVYVNGYIRSYAKLLGLAADPLIQAWGAQFPNAMQSQRADLDEAQARNWSVASVSPEASSGLGRWVLIAILASIVFIYFVSNQEPKETPSKGVVGDEQVSSQAPTELLDYESPMGEVQAVEDVTEAAALIGSRVAEPLAEIVVAVAETNVESNFGSSVEGSDESNVEAISAETSSRVESESAPEVETLPSSEVQLNLSSASIVQLPEVATLAIGQANALGVLPGAEAIQENAARAEIEDVADGSVNSGVFDSASKVDWVVDEAASLGAAFSLPRLTLEGNDRIVLTFTGDWWFEIKTVDDEMLHADLGRPEQVREYFGQGPFAIKLGFAQGAAVEFNGRSVALAPHTRNNVANLVLGQ